MPLRRFFRHLVRDCSARSCAGRSPQGRARRGFRLLLEPLEDRVVPTLLGLAIESIRPDISSGALTNFSYTQVGNNNNPLHYDARALALSLNNATNMQGFDRFVISNPSSGVSTTRLDLRLNNAGQFVSGVAGDDFSVTGKVTIGSTTFNGTLLTAEVEEFGFANTITPSSGEFEVRIKVSGGLLTQQPNGVIRIGKEMVVQVHQPGLRITSFPQTFSIRTTSGSSDTRKVKEFVTNAEPVDLACGCANSDQPTGPAQGNAKDTGNGGVIPNTAEALRQVLILTIPGRAMDWMFQLVYRSGIQTVGPLGHNWEMNYYRRLIEVNARNLKEVRCSFPLAQLGDVVRLDGQNRADLYVRNPDGSYTSPHGFFTRLLKNGGGSFSERDQGGTVISYGPAAADGTAGMTSMADRNNNALRFQYDGLGQLVQVTDTLGRPIQYQYDGLGQLTQVTDYFNRTLRFQYDSHGELVGATSPAVTGTPTGNDFPNGKTERYTYSSGFTTEKRNHNLTSVIAPNEVGDGSLTPRVQYTYDSLDRVVTQQLGGTNQIGVPAGGTITYQYTDFPDPPPNDFTTPDFQTAVTDRNGNVTEYQYNMLGNIVRLREFTNRDVRPSDPAFFETRYTYDGEYRLLQVTLPEGNTVTYTYDSSNPDRFQQGNLLSETRTPDADRGGDQTSIRTTYTYEPIYNQVRTVTEPRGNDASYVPQNGGAQSAARYTTTYTYDYQEGTDFAGLGAILGVSAAQAAALLAAAGVPMGLGDVNGDGVTTQLHGNVIRAQQPTVQLLPGSNQAVAEGTTLQPITTTYVYNDFGQMTRSTDPERNVDTYDYYPERDPNGDGIIDNPAGNPTTGGYLRQTTRDTTSDPLRDTSTNPAPTNIRTVYEYDAVGNVTREIDGRGIATTYVYNQLNQVVQMVRAAAHNLLVPDPAEPVALTDFQYVTRYFYDFNDNLVVQQVEDRGNTSATDGNPAGVSLPPFASNIDPVGGPSFFDTVYQYDILDQTTLQAHELRHGITNTSLITRYRYDPNGNQVLTIQPEGNATSSFYDERDLLFQSTRGATGPAPLTLLAGSDPTNYDVRGGLPSTMTYNYDLNRNLIETVDASDTDLSTANNSDLAGAGDRTRYIYDGFDRRTSVVDSVGNQTVYQYDPVSNVVRTLQFGPVGGFSPTSDGPDALLRPVSSLGVIQAGNLVITTLLSAVESLYDELSRLFQTDQVLFINTIPTARPPDVADGATDLGKGNLTPGDTGAIPGVAGVTILGRVSDRTEYDRNSRVTFTVQDDTDTSRTFYDGANRVIKTLDPEGNTVETAYDDNNNVIETRETDVTDVAGVASEVFLTTSFYDSLDRVQRTVDNLGQTMEYRYDSRDNLVAMADANGPVSGVISRRVFPNGALTVNAINTPGNVTTYFYDGLSRLVRTEAYLTATGLGDGLHVGASPFGVKNDAAFPESFPPAVDPSKGGGDGIIRTGYNWDDNSLQSSLLDDQGNVTVYLYDNLNRRITETKGLVVTTTPLDKNKVLGPREVLTPTPATINNPADIADALLNAQLAKAKVLIDEVFALFPPLADSIDDAPPTTIAWGYDPDDNVLILEDENDSETFTRYDALNRRIAVRIFRSEGNPFVGPADNFAGDTIFAPAPVSDPRNPSDPFPPVGGTNKQDYQYDGLSRLVRATDNNDPSPAADDSLVTYAYDSLSRVIEETQQFGALPGKVVSTSWRAENLRSELIYPNDRMLVYTYDGLDRLVTVADAGAAQPIAVYSYIGVYRVLVRSYPQNGTLETYLDNSGTVDQGYDGLRRPVTLRHLRADNSLIVGFFHTYDRMSNKLREDKLHDPANNEVYQYDSAYRLILFQRPNVGALDPLHDNWKLDGVGNWDSVTTTQFGPATTESRDHSSFNEITKRTDGGMTTILSDDNGNEFDDGTFTFTWDYLNRLQTVTRKTGNLLIAEYSYDAMGRRVQKVVTNSGALNGTTTFYLDGWQEIEERNGADVLTQQYVYGIYIDEPLVMDRNLNGDGTATGVGDQRLFYHQNTLYSVYALTDTAGTIVEGYLYDAYGRQTVYGPGVNGVVDFGGDDVITAGGRSAVGNPSLFTGRRLDPETGLYYYRARYMDTVQGRFLQRDPIGFGGGDTNLYGFVGNDPTNQLDPSGLILETPEFRERLQQHQAEQREKTFNEITTLVNDYLVPQPDTLVYEKKLACLCARTFKEIGIAVDIIERLLKRPDVFLGPIPAEKLNTLVGALGSGVFQVRQNASAELRKLAKVVDLPQLKAILAMKPGLEVTRRIEAIVEPLERGEESPLDPRVGGALYLLRRLASCVYSRGGGAEKKLILKIRSVLQEVARRGEGQTKMAAESHLKEYPFDQL